MNTKHVISIVVTIALVMLTVFLAQKYTVLNLTTFVYPVIAILGVVSFVLGEWISKALDKRPALFVNRYMLGFMIKMFGFLAFIGTYVYLNPENKFQVALTLFVCYLIFNIHMIVFLKNSEKKQLLKNSPSKKTNL